MNESVLIELKNHVERAVRPLRIGLSRKRQIREELLAHLVSSYDEELARLGDEQKAVEQSRRRFGDAEEIKAELQHNVSVNDRLCYWMDRMRLEPRESSLHFFGKHFLLACLVYAATMLLMLLLQEDTRRLSELGVALRIFAAVGVVMWLAGSLFVWLSNRIGRVPPGSDAGRFWPLAARYYLPALLIFPLAMIATYWGLGHPAPPAIALASAGLASPFAPLALKLMSRQAAEDIRHDEEWASLHVEA